MPHRRNAGYTLIEIMVAVVIIGIIAAIAWPTFEAQKLRSKRTDAVKGLTIAVTELERCLSDEGAYDDADCDSITDTSPDGHYSITAVTDSDTFDLTATPTVNNDADCTTLTLDHLGRKDYTGTAPNRKRCWSQ